MIAFFSTYEPNTYGKGFPKTPGMILVEACICKTLVNRVNRVNQVQHQHQRKLQQYHTLGGKKKAVRGNVYGHAQKTSDCKRSSYAQYYDQGGLQIIPQSHATVGLHL